jgi:hypothetical protein
VAEAEQRVAGDGELLPFEPIEAGADLGVAVQAEANVAVEREDAGFRQEAAGTLDATAAVDQGRERLPRPAGIAGLVLGERQPEAALAVAGLALEIAREERPFVAPVGLALPGALRALGYVE